MKQELKSKIKASIARILEKVRIKVIRLRPGRGRENERYSYQKEHVDFKIKETDKVLDIGSGGHPFPLATHLADLYTGDTSHRADKLAVDDRPLVVCDIENMPFSEKYFDFVYCSHVLEHVEHPAIACKELMRIGKRGYIETPTKTTDLMFNFPRLKNHHKWHIELINNTLIFMEWKEEEKIDLGTSYFFEEYHSIWNNAFQRMVVNNRRLFTNMLLWENGFNYIVIDKSGKVIANESDLDASDQEQPVHI
jgi:SAM-dependent methyltransferase